MKRIIHCLIFCLPLSFVFGQNITYQVDIDNLYSNECGDCSGTPDYQFWIKLYQNGTDVANWNPYYEQDCGWLGRSNLSYYDNTNAPVSTVINLQFDAEEQDNFVCGGNDGDCNGYSSPNGNQTITAAAAGTWHYFNASRNCDGVNWQVRYSFFWNYLPINTPPAPTTTGADCSLLLVGVNSTQSAVNWYWQTSPTGTSTANLSNNPPSVPNGNTTYYLRPYGLNTNQWGTASSGLSLSRSCNFRCYTTTTNPPSIPRWTDVSTSAGWQSTFNTASQFATGSYITEVNTDAVDYGARMQLSKGATLSTASVSLVNNNSNTWTTWNGTDPNFNGWRLATDNGDNVSRDPGNVALTVCACKQASAGIISSSTGASACPDEVFTLSHNGSTSSRFDAEGYGDEMRWFKGSCGGTMIGSGLSITVNGNAGVEQAVTYYAGFYNDGVLCGACEQYTVTFIDNTKPVVACPANQVDNLDGNCQWLVPDYRSLATITDNCVALADLTITQSPASGTLVSASHGSIQAVTITANDGYGNSESCSFNVTLSDNEPPVALCQNYTLVLNSSGNGTLTTANIDNGSFDNCGTTNLSLSKTNFTCADVGVNTVTLTVNDGNGNSSTCTATVTVQDNTNPTAVCQNYTLVLDATGNGTLTTADINNGSSDACGIATLSLSKTSFTCADVGVNTVTLTVTDNNSRVSTCNATVTVQEILPTPATVSGDELICRDASVALTGNNPSVGTGAWSWTGPRTVTYETGSSSTNNIEVSFSASGIYTGTWTITNVCGTQTSADVEVSVNAPSTIVMADAIGTCESNSINEWVHLYDASGFIIASVNDNNQDLGDVTAEVYYHSGNAFEVNTTAGGCGTQAVLNRSFVINSTIAPSGNVRVRLYYTAAELASLQALAGCGDPNGCRDDDDVCSVADLVVTQITDLNPADEDGIFVAGAGTSVFHGSPTNNGVSNATFNANYLEINVSSFSEFWIHGSEHAVALPVELTKFTAKAVEGKYIQLDWTTATEINNEGFEIERSVNGIEFNNIGFVNGNGNSSNIHNYEYFDEEVSKNTTYYYRLKQVDYDGSFEYSNIVTAKLEGKDEFTIGNLIPNPSQENGKVSVSIISSSTENISISVYNAIGVNVLNSVELIQEGNSLISIPTNDLSSGTYFINFEGSFGRETKRLVIVK